MSRSNSSSVKNSDECLVDSNPRRPRHILRRHFSEDVLGVAASTPGSRFPGNGARHRLQKTGSRIFEELNKGHRLVSRLSDGNLLKDKDRDKDKEKESDVDLMATGLSFRAISELIKSNNLQGLKLFLDSRHANIDDRDEEGRTVLILAASLGKLDFIPLLLSHGADIHAEDNDKATALHAAAREGHADVCLELLENGAKIEACDSGQWTPLLWACYRGHVAAADCLISRGANINARGMYQVSSLLWAAGRGHYEIVQLLIDNNVKVDIGDKYGTTALIWACRKGHLDTVELLLRGGASVDAVGMYSWTPLLVATRGNFVSIVEKLLEKSPNINTVDKDGMTALFIACKEGYQDIAFMLLNAGAYTNLQDRSGDTNLIYACKGGHKSIVEALIKKYADVDIKGKDNKTCLHWAIDKNHTAIVKLLLTANPDLEAKTVDGDTPLLRAVRQRNAGLVELLLEKKAKISAADLKGDTALHIAMRARSKGIVEILLRNPKHSQLLYRPNRQGETPYNIDAASQKTIMGQIFGARRLNANEDGENILGYDLYSSALADILTEPALTMPITVGLYAKWGSGKSFLLGKLKDEMLSFTREWIVEPAFKNSVLLFLVVLHMATIIGLIGWLIPYTAFNMYEHSFYVGIGVFAFVFIVSYIFLIILWKGTIYYDWYSLYSLKMFLAARFHSLKLVLNVIFSHPPGTEILYGTDETMLNHRAQPLRLLFTDQTKVITSAGGQNSVTSMLGSLYDAVENQYGLFATRLFRAFRPNPLSPTSRISWRRLCCIPYVMIYLTCFVCLTACTILIAITIEYNFDISKSGGLKPTTTTTTTPAPSNSSVNPYSEYQPNEDDKVMEQVSADFVFGLLLALSIIVGAALVANIYTIGNCVVSLAFSQRKHLQRAVAKLDVVKSEGYLQALKNEVQMMVDMVMCLDAFTGQRTRLVVVVDGLDSCEQSKVLSILDAVHMLFSDDGSPFIILLAIDPHVITKAIELNIHQAYRDTSISGDAYLRNLVHMPFFLQNVSLRRVAVAQQACGGGGFGLSKKNSTLWLETDDRKMSTESSAAWKKGGGGGKHSKSFFRRTRHDSIGSSVGSRINHVGTSAGGGGGAGELTSVSLTDDYFSDVNVKSVRRLMNVIYVMGRLMKAFNIDFSWYHLAVWVNLSEQWPYRLSWLIFFFDMNEEVLEDSTPLKELYDRVRGVMPTQKDLEPLLEMDRDEKKLEALLSLKKKMTVRDIKTFLPFSINLDPYIKKVIKDEYQIHEEVLNNNGHTGPLTQRQAAGLSRKLSSDPISKSGSLVGIPQTPVPPTYHNFAMHHMAPWPQFQPPAGYGFDSRGGSPPDHSEIELDPELYLKPLSRKTVEEICHVVRCIEGLSSGHVETYCNAITSQNISGAVLANCKIDELKAVLSMNFGDWELFQLVVFALRDRQRKMKLERKTLSLQPPSLNGLPRRSPHPTGSPDRKRRIGIIPESVPVPTPQHSSQPQSHPSSSNLNPPIPKVASNVENQVNYEDAMISGLLSTLNEEAQEDVLMEELAGSSENISFNASLENINKSFEALSPTPSMIMKSSRDLEKGSVAAGISAKSHSIVASSIGGGGGIASGWDFGSSGDLGMISVPTSPTVSQSPVLPSSTSRTRTDSEKSMRRKARHLRDRLDSLSEDEYANKSSGPVIGRNMSRSFGNPGSGGGDLPPENDEDEPYAWISQTAPASPRGCRSRAGSIIPEDDLFAFGASDLTSQQRRESMAYSIKRRGTATTYNSKESVYLAEAPSMEKLSDKVKKKIRHALLAMDNHKSGMPAFQRAKPTGGSMRAHFYVSEADSSASLAGKARQKSFVHANSLHLPDSPRTNDDVDFREVEEEESCSSPEQETVAKRPETSFRGPPVHQLFNAIKHAAEFKEEEFLMTPEAVSPDPNKNKDL